MNKLNIESRNIKLEPHSMRQMGFVPGIMYGESLKSTPIKMSFRELEKVTKESGEVYKIMTAKGPAFAKFISVEKRPASKEFLHFSLEMMPSEIENEINVPLELVGTPIGVKKGGVLVVMMDEVTLNGKPSSIPDLVMGDISHLDIGEQLTTDDLIIPRQISVAEKESKVVAFCNPPKKNED